MDLTAIFLLALPAALYLRATHVLSKRGYRVPPFQQACWFLALTALAIALFSPLDHLGETDLVSAHMGQHLLIIDIAAPLLLLGIRSPVYAFMLPRPLLVPLARNRVLRALFRALRKPAVAAAIFVVLMWGWHFAGPFDAALRHPLVHDLQHQCFLFAGVMFWLPLLEPWRRRVPGGLWKIGYVVGVRTLSMFVGFAMLAVRHPIYEFYADRATKYGLTPLSDQQLAGTIMMSVDLMVMVGAMLFFFMRTSQDDTLAGRDHPEMPSDITDAELAAAADREAGRRTNGTANGTSVPTARAGGGS